MCCGFHVKCGMNLHLAEHKTTHTYTDTAAATDGLIVPVVILTTATASFAALKEEKSFKAENGQFVKAWEK